MLTWEFPPRVVGEIATHVDTLARSLAMNGVDVHVFTFQEDGSGLAQEVDGIKVYRVSNPVKTHINIVTWDITLMTEYERVVSDVYYSLQQRIDLMDAHEWTCVPAAVLLKKAFNLPYVYTIHSLEEHRSHFANSPLNIAINNIERLGIVEADMILVKSVWMKEEITKLHPGFDEKTKVISLNSATWIKDLLNTYNTVLSQSKG